MEADFCVEALKEALAKYDKPEIFNTDQGSQFTSSEFIQVLIQQPDYQAARNYWKVLKNRLNKEGSEPVTKCNRLKLVAEPWHVCRPAGPLRILPLSSGL